MSAPRLIHKSKLLDAPEPEYVPRRERLEMRAAAMRRQNWRVVNKRAAAIEAWKRRKGQAV